MENLHFFLFAVFITRCFVRISFICFLFSVHGKGKMWSYHGTPNSINAVNSGFRTYPSLSLISSLRGHSCSNLVNDRAPNAAKLEINFLNPFPKRFVIKHATSPVQRARCCSRWDASILRRRTTTTNTLRPYWLMLPPGLCKWSWAAVAEHDFPVQVLSKWSDFASLKHCRTNSGVIVSNFQGKLDAGVTPLALEVVNSLKSLRNA